MKPASVPARPTSTLTERRYPCLFECYDGSVYLVLEDLMKYAGSVASNVILRLDGEPTQRFDTVRVHYTLMCGVIESMKSWMRSRGYKSRFSTARERHALDSHPYGSQASRRRKKARHVPN